MNLIIGFKRVSVVVWSVLALGGLALGFGGFYEWYFSNNSFALFAGLGLLFSPVLTFFLHKVTCWLIDGFTSANVKGG